jgi:hypothetical protein
MTEFVGYQVWPQCSIDIINVVYMTTHKGIILN